MNIYGLQDGLHGFHIHEFGDLSDGCNTACSHFNPFNKKHGGLHSKERHASDLEILNQLIKKYRRTFCTGFMFNKK